MPTADEVAEALSAATEDPLHVLEPSSLTIRYQNAASMQLFGRLADQSSLNALQQPLPEEFQFPLRDILRLNTREGPRAYLLKSRERDGWLVQILKDVSDLELQLDDLCRGVQLDPVSQTLNRRALLYALVREMARAERSGEALHYLVIDLPGLDEIDAKHGGDAVNQVIATVAGLLRSTLRQTDVIGRCERDRLALILPCTDAAGAAWVAERSLQLVEAAPLRFADAELHIGLKTGFAQFRSGDTPEDMALRARQGFDQPMDTNSRAKVRS